MKQRTKYISILMLFSFLFPLSVWAYTNNDINSANFLAEKWIINDHSTYVLDYNLNDFITRREMLKVMMNLSWKTLTENCTWVFSDMNMQDWGCKYAESALREWYIAKNQTFRPDDLVTQIEALKMIMQAKGIIQDKTSDWRVWYVSSAQKNNIISENYLDYNLRALRSWIFTSSARTYSEYDYSIPDASLTPEEEELFQFLLDL